MAYNGIDSNRDEMPLSSQRGLGCSTSNRLKAWALATHILFALIIGIAIVLTLSIGLILFGCLVPALHNRRAKQGFGQHSTLCAPWGYETPISPVSRAGLASNYPA